MAGLGVRSLYFSRVGTSNRETDQKFELLSGEETIEEKLNEMKFRISPGLLTHFILSTVNQDGSGRRARAGRDILSPSLSRPSPCPDSPRQSRSTG